MGLLSEKDKENLRKKFEKLEEEIRLAVFTQEMECMSCKEVREIVQEVATTSDKVKVEVYDLMKDSEKVKEYNVDKIPAIAPVGKKDYGIRFYGMPGGYEFASFIEALIDVSSGATKLSEKTKNKLKAVDKPAHVQVFVLPTCPACPKAVRLAHQFAIENDFIKAEMIEVMEFPHLAQKYGVMSVPKVVINEKIEFVGALPEEHFLEHIIMAVK